MFHRFTASGGVLLFLVLSAASAHAQRFSDWSAPTNLGPAINTASFEG